MSTYLPLGDDATRCGPDAARPPLSVTITTATGGSNAQPRVLNAVGDAGRTRDRQGVLGAT